MPENPAAQALHNALLTQGAKDGVSDSLSRLLDEALAAAVAQGYEAGLQENSSPEVVAAPELTTPTRIGMYLIGKDRELTGDRSPGRKLPTHEVALVWVAVCGRYDGVYVGGVWGDLEHAKQHFNARDGFEWDWVFDDKVGAWDNNAGFLMDPTGMEYRSVSLFPFEVQR